MSTSLSATTSPLAPDGLLAAGLIAAAERRIAAVLAPTPVWFSPARQAFLKLENLQTTGAYKIRGAWNALCARSERGDRRPIFAASAGNHGIGVAWAAERLGIAATVVVPEDAPAGKVRACRALGARVIPTSGGFDACALRARELARSSGGAFLHAFDDAEVIAGQATVASELAGLCPDVVLVPVGGGGLVAGMGTVLRRAGVRVVGVQVVGVDAYRRVVAAGPGADAATFPLEPPRVTLADGLRVHRPGQLTTRIGAAALDEIVLVTEAEVIAAVASLAAEEKIVAEGAGAVAVAALPRVRGARKLAVVSGGNIDPDVLSRILSHATAHAA